MKTTFIAALLAMSLAASLPCHCESVPPDGEEETEYYPETVELTSKIMVDIPRGFELDEENSGFGVVCMDSVNTSISVYCIQNSSTQHEAEIEVKSRRRRVKRIITDIEVPVDRHVGRYLETHVVRPDYEMCFYIGLMDLTKVGDVIRGRTFSAFMPLIAVALIYLLLVVFFSWLIGKLERRLRSSER